jgi:hypothetical protein
LNAHHAPLIASGIHWCREIARTHLLGRTPDDLAVAAQFSVLDSTRKNSCGTFRGMSIVIRTPSSDTSQTMQSINGEPLLASIQAGRFSRFRGECRCLM